MSLTTAASLLFTLCLCSIATPQDFEFSAFGTATIDGVDSVGEWDNADSFGTDQARNPWYTVLVMNDHENLYLGVRVGGMIFDDTRVQFLLHEDVDTLPQSGGDAVVLGADGYVDSTLDGPCEQVFFPCDTLPDDQLPDGTSDGEGRMSTGDDIQFFEIAHPLDSDDDLHDISVGLGDLMGTVLHIEHREFRLRHQSREPESARSDPDQFPHRAGVCPRGRHR